MNYDLNQYIYPSRRRVILGKKGVVATSQPLATLAGIEMFLAGGNAVDAAIATAITLTVVEPTSNGIGSDAFAIIWDGKLQGLNASGKSPQYFPLDAFAGLNKMPELGWLTVTVPGAVSAWYHLWERWGKLPFEQLFTPAIRYAEEGFPVSPVTAQAWQRAEQVYLSLEDPEFQPFKAVFFTHNRAPKTGEIWGSLHHANTLREIARTGGESFYRGKLGEAIASFANETGGYLSLEDLRNHQPLWVNPISTQYRDLEVWEIPPNGQGIGALIALNILEGFAMDKTPRDSGINFHRQIEAMKLAFADIYRHIADPDFMEITVNELLDKTYAETRRNLIQDHAIPLAKPGLPKGGTVYLCTADQDLMVSFIQSNYEAFGSGIVVPETGIALQCRGSGFILEKGHPNQVGANKRPFHTIIPGFLTQGGHPLGPFGVMGAPMQPQGHLQMVVNLSDHHLNPQTALDAPRWRFLEGKSILLERGVGDDIVQDLIRRGHQIEIAPEYHFGKGQIILRQNGVLVAGSEPRGDGLALGY